jgi:uncharacterized repeat protein (TIGR02543 family)
MKYETLYLSKNMRMTVTGELKLKERPTAILSIISRTFLIEAKDSNGNAIEQFPEPQTLKLLILESDLNESGFSISDKNKVKVYNFDRNTGVWVEVTGGIIDGDEICVQISKTGIYALGIEVNIDWEADPDKDGLTTAQEDVNANGIIDPRETDPFNPDTDGDGYTDGLEARLGSNPLDSNSIPESFNLTLYSRVGGMTDPLPGKYAFLKGTKVSIIARPATGYVFTKWTGNVPEGEETNPILTITMDSNKTIMANFILANPPLIAPSRVSLYFAATTGGGKNG